MSVVVVWEFSALKVLFLSGMVFSCLATLVPHAANPEGYLDFCL